MILWLESSAAGVELWGVRFYGFARRKQATFTSLEMARRWFPNVRLIDDLF